MARETKMTKFVSRVRANKTLLKFRERKQNGGGSSGKHQEEKNQT